MDWATEIAKTDGVCEVCGGSLARYGTPQLAHRVANTKTNRRIYGELVVDHSLNLVPVCSLKCNDSCNIAHDKGAVLDLLTDILMYEYREYRGYRNGQKS